MKAFRALSVFDYFFTRYWIFTSSNYVELWSKMSDRDRQIFYYDVRDLDWRAYFETYILGTRQYIFKESITTVPEANKKGTRYVTAFCAPVLDSYSLTRYITWRRDFIFFVWFAAGCTCWEESLTYFFMLLFYFFSMHLSKYVCRGNCNLVWIR